MILDPYRLERYNRLLTTRAERPERLVLTRPKYLYIILISKYD